MAQRARGNGKDLLPVGIIAGATEAVNEKTILASTPIHKEAAAAHALSMALVVDGLVTMGLTGLFDPGNFHARGDNCVTINIGVANLGHV